jgi:cytochrome bd ubiquinol oxidase subunit I
LTAILQTFYYRTGSLDYKRLTKFFGKLFVIIFAWVLLPVLYLNSSLEWPGRAIRALWGIFSASRWLLKPYWLFSLNQPLSPFGFLGGTGCPKGIHLLSIWLVAIGSNLSALWIIIANAWMQVPVGYVLNEGRAELSDFVAVMLNEQMLVMAQHTIIAAFTTGGLFMLGISAWHILRKNQVEIFTKSAHIALVFTAVSSLLVATTGHKHAQHTVKHQPMKMAAMEGLWESEQPASFSLFALLTRKTKPQQGIEIALYAHGAGLQQPDQ